MHRIERIELPHVFAYSGDTISQLTEAFKNQTGIDGEVDEVVIETKYNAGSRRRKKFIPCLVFRISAKNRTAKPSSEFSGFKWLSLDNAKKEKLARTAEWIWKRM